MYKANPEITGRTLSSTTSTPRAPYVRMSSPGAGFFGNSDDDAELVVLTSVKYVQEEFARHLRELISLGGPYIAPTNFIRTPTPSPLLSSPLWDPMSPQLLPETIQSRLPSPLLAFIPPQISRARSPETRPELPPLRDLPELPELPPMLEHFPNLLPYNQGDIASSSSSLFIGLRRDRYQLRQTFFETSLQLEPQPLISAILQWVLALPLSKSSMALSKFPSSPNVLVATSRLPVDNTLERYDHYTTHYKFIGSLTDLLDNQTERISPAPHSSERTALLQHMLLESDHSLYILYIEEASRLNSSVEKPTNAYLRLTLEAQ
jgi:hypothetical protein